MRPVIIASLFVLFQQGASAQYYPEKLNYRLGLSFGIGPSRVLGTELEKPSFRTGIQSGIYYRFRLAERLHGESNLGVALRGSRFKHQKDDYYQQLSLIVIEAPLLLMFDLSAKKSEHLILAGITPTYLAQSEFYIVPEPTARDEFRNQGLYQYGLNVSVGYHRNTYYNGWRFSGNYSLLNMNDGLILPGILPTTGKGGTIQMLSFSVQTYF